MKAHRTDLVSFAFGLVFLALSAWWLLAQLLGLALPPVGWFLASALILIGVFGLVGALRSSRPNQPEPIAAAGATEADAATPVSGASVSGAPVSGASVSGAGASTTGTPLPVWEAERSTWDAVPSEPTTPAPTVELRGADTPPADVIHPAWLAHPPSEPPTEPVPAQPGGGDQPGETTGDQPGDEREGRRGEV